MLQELRSVVPEVFGSHSGAVQTLVLHVKKNIAM